MIPIGAITAILPLRCIITSALAAVASGWLMFHVGSWVGEDGAFDAGYRDGEARERAVWQRVREDAMAAAEKARQEAEERHREAESKADALRRQVEVARQDAAVRRRERDAALSAVVAGRDCLSADAVRLLNNPAGAVPGVPQTAGPGPTGPAAGGATATDRDIALWISDARERYNSCASQVNAWVAWYEGL